MSAENIRNTYRRQGAQAERERIIKLLEDFDKTNASCQCCFTELCVNDAIALIKGENK